MWMVGVSMKRISAELSDDQIIELLSNDPIGRNQEIAEFLQLLNKIEEGYSFFLNAAWGDGKTVFVKQAALALRVFNENLKSNDEEQKAIRNAPSISGVNMAEPYMPVYYNSWKNDSLGDPLPSLIATIATEHGSHCSTDDGPLVPDAVIETLDAILKPFGLNVLSDIRDAFSGKDYLKAFDERKELQGKVSSLIDSVLAERANKLVLFVDEIDRCSPSFALKLLEEIKFLFENDKVILVFSTDMHQLGNIVSGAYGDRFDGSRYLGRFYDRIIPLSKPDPAAYLATCGMENSFCRRSDDYTQNLNQVITDLSNVSALSMRETNCYLESLEEVKTMLERAPYDTSWPKLFFCAGVVPVLLLIKLRDIEAYDKVVNNADPQPIVDYLKKSPVLKQMNESACSSLSGKGSNAYASSEDDGQLIADLCEIAFGSPLSEKHRLACRHLPHETNGHIANLAKQAL